MRDPRLTAANGRIAHISLQGEVAAERYVDGRWMMVQQPMANITDEPRGKRVSQLLFGEQFLVLDLSDGFAFGQAARDGQVGYIVGGALTGAEEATHWVTAPATHLYPKPDLKAPPEVALFFGSPLKVMREMDDYVRIHTGHFVPKQHVMPIRARFGDPAGVADMLLGTPYLWGGVSRWGIDCSGLVQAALIACGIDCPRDSDQQTTVGMELPDDAPLQRNDLIFWKGHVGIMVSDTTLLHANVHHMAVAYEPLVDAAARIAAREFGPVTHRRRLPI